MTSSSFIARPAYGKVNLALSVGPPIPAGAPKAGFHPIASWMACVGLADDVSITKLASSESSRYSISFAPDAIKPSPIDWPIEQDLAVRAHRLLEAAVGRSLPLELALRKRVPVGGGLGGGSSDAATTMMAIRDLFGLELSNLRLASMSASLGSDIAFFFDDQPPPRPAIVSGLGDELERFQRVPSPILLIVPPMGCPTGPVYKAYDSAPVPLRDTALRMLVTTAAKESQLPDPSELFNDLAAPACRVEPRLREMIDAISRCTELAIHMTGSGSTLFIVPERTQGVRELARAESLIRRELPQLKTLLTELL